jgi:myo-inositol-1(or 4)-monophosphatase
MDDITFNRFENFVAEVTDFKEEFCEIKDYDAVSFELKEDETPVTQVDYSIEQSIRESIAETFPYHSIVGEEYPDTIHKSSFKWIIDPIDGTFSLTKGVPLYGTLLGLLKDNSPMYGSVRFPLLQKLICGDGKSAYENGETIICDNSVTLGESLILTTDENRIKLSKYKSSWERLNDLVSNRRTWGDCYGYYLVCSGKAQVMFDIDLKPCDILPLIPIIKGAGCEIIELEKPFKDIIVCAKSLKQEILECF